MLPEFNVVSPVTINASLPNVKAMSPSLDKSPSIVRAPDPPIVRPAPFSTLTLTSPRTSFDKIKALSPAVTLNVSVADVPTISPNNWPPPT